MGILGDRPGELSLTDRNTYLGAVGGKQLGAGTAKHNLWAAKNVQAKVELDRAMRAAGEQRAGLRGLLRDCGRVTSDRAPEEPERAAPASRLGITAQARRRSGSLARGQEEKRGPALRLGCLADKRCSHAARGSGGLICKG